MKKSIKILALTLAMVMLCGLLVSCGTTLSGEYELDATVAGTGVVTTYKFSGKKVTITSVNKVAGKQVGDEVVKEGTYSIKDDKMTVEIDDETDTFDFEKTEDGIKIGIVELKKK